MNPLLLQYLVSAYGQALGTKVPQVLVMCHKHAGASADQVKVIEQGMFSHMTGAGEIVIRIPNHPQRLKIPADKVIHVRVDETLGFQIVLPHDVKNIYEP